MGRVGIPLARNGARPATRGRVNAVATPSAATSPSQPRARSMAGIERLKCWRRPSRCRRSSPARSSSFTWRETAGSDTRWSAASSLMVRVRWASRRSTSRRSGLARAEKTRSSDGLQILTILLIIDQSGCARQPASQRRCQPQASVGAGGRGYEALERQGDSCRRAAPVAVLAEDALAGAVEEVET